MDTFDEIELNELLVLAQDKLTALRGRYNVLGSFSQEPQLAKTLAEIEGKILAALDE